MTLIEHVMSAAAWMSPAEKNSGLLLVARMGRYAQASEREAAFYLPALRNAPTHMSRVNAVVDQDTIEHLEILLTSASRRQVRRVCSSGDISAARLLYCELCDELVQKGSAGQSATQAAVATLQRYLPEEALSDLNSAELEKIQLEALFSLPPVLH